MAEETSFTIERLGPGDAARMAALNDLFACVFEEPETYQGARPGAGYLDRLLADPGFIVLVAVQGGDVQGGDVQGGDVIGGLVAYELKKFEQERSELYLYDLGVVPAQRRRGVATALIEALKPIARALGAWTIFVQADGDDPEAAALYARFGRREEVQHFDIALQGEGTATA